MEMSRPEVVSWRGRVQRIGLPLLASRRWGERPIRYLCRRRASCLSRAWFRVIPTGAARVVARMDARPSSCNVAKCRTRLDQQWITTCRLPTPTPRFLCWIHIKINILTIFISLKTKRTILNKLFLWIQQRN